MLVGASTLESGGMAVQGRARLEAMRDAEVEAGGEAGGKAEGEAGGEAEGADSGRRTPRMEDGAVAVASTSTEQQLVQQRAQTEQLKQQLEQAKEQRAQAEKQLARMRGDAAELGDMDASALEQLEVEVQATLVRVQERRKEERMCGICMERPKNVALVPCGHMLCSVCQPTLHQQRCHICQQAIERHLRTY